MKWHASLLLIAACGATKSAAPPAPAPAAASARGATLPVELIDDRWFLVAPLATGGALRFYLDSAGGMFVAEAAATRLGLARETEDGQATVAVPAFVDPHIPRPVTARLPVYAKPFAGADGMLGAPWFAGHAFLFDYPKRELSVLASLPTVAAERRIAVHFAPGMPFGRIQATIAGETLDLLLDTGATVSLTEPARATVGGAAVERATSFITKSVLDRWHAAHPEWRMIADADTIIAGSPMIEVPRVTVAGFDVGPVWFTQRPDDNFHKWMAQWTDKPLDGALGGNAFRTLRVGVDWTAGAATFER